MITTPLVACEPYIAAAAVLLSTSIDSMSLGLMSATRLVPFSSFELSEPVATD